LGVFLIFILGLVVSAATTISRSINITSEKLIRNIPPVIAVEIDTRDFD